MPTNNLFLHAYSVFVGIVTLPSCKAPDADWQLRVPPSFERVYKLDQAADFENLNFAVEFQGAQLHPPALTVHLLHDSQLLLTRYVESEEFRRDTELGEKGLSLWRVENLHFVVPAARNMNTLELHWHDGSARSQRLPVLHYQQHNRFRLPLLGCWFVASGHDLGIEHRRWYSKGHFAWDFVLLDGPHGMHADKTEVWQYRAFGATVLAPADGIVVDANDSFPDLMPGEPGDVATANSIMLDHGHGEFSKLAHLAYGSLRVHVGDRVVVGQRLASVGNSGRSDAPHLHFHVQSYDATNPDSNLTERPLPIELNDYLLTSNEGVMVPVRQGRPRRGEFVCRE